MKRLVNLKKHNAQNLKLDLQSGSVIENIVPVSPIRQTWADEESWVKGGLYHRQNLYTIRRMKSRLLRELRQLTIRRYFLSNKRMCANKVPDQTAYFGCAAFGPKMSSSNHVTKENWSLYVETLLKHSSGRMGTGISCHQHWQRNKLGVSNFSRNLFKKTETVECTKTK